MSALELAVIYEDYYPVLSAVAHEIKTHVSEMLDEERHQPIEGVSGRAKGIESFLEKADRRDGKTKEKKYIHPLEEIQDQIGVRVVTYYLHDIEPVREIILKDFAKVEDKNIVPDDPSKFGYEARHLICRIPKGIRKKHGPHIGYFELQVCTLFQHAWAQANHDLMYKPPRDPSNFEERLLAWAASQAFGADKVFEDLWNRMQKEEPSD